MDKQCDHKSVGMLIQRDGKILLIERKNVPFGFAPPAGHVDEDASFEEAAKRELQEEVGLKSHRMGLMIEGRKNNPCGRSNGRWHYWKIYESEAEGEVERSDEEAKQVQWCAKNELMALAKKTERYLRREMNDEEWEESPGLEPVWYEWLKELKII